MILVTYWGFSMAIILKNIPSISGVQAYSQYALASSTLVTDEGTNYTVTLKTRNVKDGTLVPYTITGVSSADISGVPLTGAFTVMSGTAVK